MFGFEFWEIALLVACVLGAVIIVRLLFRKDDEIEDRRKNALKAVGELRRIKDDVTAELLEAYAVGDYTGFIKKGADIVRQLMDPNGVVDMRAEMVLALLPELLKGDKYDTRAAKVIQASIDAGDITLPGAEPPAMNSNIIVAEPPRA